MSLANADHLVHEEMGDVVQHDVPCTTCAYNLRTLSRGAKCPECGEPVMDSSPGRSHRVPPNRRVQTVIRLSMVAGPFFLLSSPAAAGVGAAFGFWKPDEVVPIFVFTLVLSGACAVWTITWAIVGVVGDDISVGPELALNRNPFVKFVRVRRSETLRITESRFLGILVYKGGLLDGFTIPPEIEGYSEVRQTLASWCPIEPDWLHLRFFTIYFVGQFCGTLGFFSMLAGISPAVRISGNLLLIALLGLSLKQLLRSRETKLWLRIFFGVSILQFLAICCYELFQCF